MKYTLDVVDPLTGEVVKQIETEAVLVIPVKNKLRYLRKEGWFLGFQRFFINLAMDRELTHADFKVLSYLLGIMDFENFVMVSINEIAKQTGLSKPTVIKSLKKLRDKGIILIEKYGRRNCYKLNPECVWRGTFSKRGKKILEFKLTTPP